MIKTLKKNPALYIGLVLPLLMILLFTGIPFISTLVVPPPKYNFIYTVKNYQMDGKLLVVGGKLELDAYNRNTYPNEAPSVYLVDVHSKKNTKLSFVMNNEENLLILPHQHRKFIVEGVSLKDLDTSTISPDEYQYITEHNDNLFVFPLFFGGNRRNSIAISRGARIERFQVPNDGYWGAKFEGWVIP